MLRYFFTSLTFMLLTLPVSAADVDVDTMTKKVGALMRQWDNESSPGAAILIARDGKIQLNKSYGMAHIESNTPIGADTKFLLASITKPFTALSIIMCEERGLLDYMDGFSSGRHLRRGTRGWP